MNGLRVVWVAILAIIIGATLTLAVTAPTRVAGDRANIVIEECEKELPRNEFCELVAVPVGEN